MRHNVFVTSKNMKIAFDAKRAYHNSTGLGNYSRDTIRILSQFHPSNQYFLFNPKKGNNFNIDASNTSEVLPDSKFYRKFSSVWRQGAIVNQLKRTGIEIYHGLSNELPKGINKSGIKTVVTIHDLIFIRFPELYPPIDRRIYKAKFKHACKIADVITAISEQTKRDIVEFFGMNPDKIKVIYQGCHQVFQKGIDESALEKVRKKYQLPKKFILNVGTIEERKNLLSAIKAIKDLDEVHLVVVGKETNYTKQVVSYITDNQLDKRVSFLKNISIDELAVLYQLATIFVYPSIFEGFGIPIIEALFSKTPVISSTGSCFSEAGGPDSIYCEPYDIPVLRQSIEKLWHDENLRKNMAQKGLSYAQKFTDTIIADNLANLYKQLMS